MGGRKVSIGWILEPVIKLGDPKKVQAWDKEY